MFTKEQRHKIYSKALVQLKREIETMPYMTYVCPTLINIANDYFCSVITYHNFSEAFPEFIKFKPVFLELGSSWWPTCIYGNQKRVEALEKCIELIK